jgi:hypothetical protein
VDNTIVFSLPFCLTRRCSKQLWFACLIGGVGYCTGHIFVLGSPDFASLSFVDFFLFFWVCICLGLAFLFLWCVLTYFKVILLLIILCFCIIDWEVVPVCAFFFAAKYGRARGRCSCSRFWFLLLRDQRKWEWRRLPPRNVKCFRIEE